MTDKELIFTNHALDRMNQLGFSKKELIKVWKGSRRIKESFFRQAYKFNKYGTKQNSIYYYHNKGVLFTVSYLIKDDKLLLITVTKKKTKKVRYA